MTKTILILAIVAAFMIGTSVSFVVLDYNAEAAKTPKIDPVAEAIDRLTAVMQGTATQGQEGPQGPSGEQGPPGEFPNIYTADDVITFSAGQQGPVIAACDDGDNLLGGGYSFTDENGGAVGHEQVTVIFSVGVFNPPESWFVGAINDGSAAIKVTSQAICADTADPPHT